ncbi:MAG: hypothetical protein HWD92_05515 [Flavobacteriia bacterium]|nr:hypothetical protein [Flavobacteriia bacterium]
MVRLSLFALVILFSMKSLGQSEETASIIRVEFSPNTPDPVDLAKRDISEGRIKLYCGGNVQESQWVVDVSEDDRIVANDIGIEYITPSCIDPYRYSDAGKAKYNAVILSYLKETMEIEDLDKLRADVHGLTEWIESAEEMP